MSTPPRSVAAATSFRVSFNRKEMMDALSFLKSLMADDSERVIVSFGEGCLLEVETKDDQPAKAAPRNSGAADADSDIPF